MTEIGFEELAILECEVGVRPSGAPTLDDVLPLVKSVRREAGSLVVEFEPAAKQALEAFAAAERLCCAAIGWEVESFDRLTLRITAEPDQIDILATSFSIAHLAQ